MEQIYISKASTISPQNTFIADDFFNAEALVCESDKCPAVDPDYKVLITDAGKRRRMGHLIKMGVSTSLACLKQADGSLFMPDAMMSATGMGGLEDTEKFLRCIIDNDEQLLNPSNFIQSTGNTFGGQTGLLLGHHGYNVTYAHGGFSMESALIDAMLQLKDGSAKTALVTGADEITTTEYEAMRKMGFWRNGRQMGEGSHSFLLTNEKEGAVCELVDVKTKRPLNESAVDYINSFIGSNGIKAEDVDLVLTGCDCDYAHLKELEESTFSTFNYKHYCGQYATASGFGLWLGAELIGRGLMPAANGWEKKQARHIVIYNEYRMNDYSLMLLKHAL
ncbi:MAG: beta-ketoacyl synthase chain length factor [Paludibacteraceae bacterium]|nr:beta-ketoacyl synthase chain length factor [Paludibacteraceae bacterium]